MPIFTPENLAQVLDTCVEHGMSFPLMLVAVGANGSIIAMRFNTPGEEPDTIVEPTEAGFALPINMMVTDEGGALAAHCKIDKDGSLDATMLIPEQARDERTAH